ncbi:MAG: rhomboid family intramembrane serine protease [Bacteroidales bacterium]|nr:rhomboid family intramembrane serine protease [Bacteroidales bacterium]
MDWNTIKYKTQDFYRNNTLLSYMIIGVLIAVILLGGRLFEAIYNAYLIYFGGSIFKHYLDEKRMLNVFLGGGIIGALMSFIIFPDLSLLIILKSGITSASLALFVAAATYVPNMEVVLILLGKVKLKFIAIVFVALDLLSNNPEDAQAKVGHVGAVLFGFLLIYLARNKNSAQTPNFIKWFTRPRGPYYKKTKPTKKAKASKRTENDEDYLSRKNKEQTEIDAILDKIKLKGYESLNAAEKQKLFDKSKNGK